MNIPCESLFALTIFEGLIPHPENLYQLCFTPSFSLKNLRNISEAAPAIKFKKWSTSLFFFKAKYYFPKYHGVSWYSYLISARCGEYDHVTYNFL